MTGLSLIVVWPGLLMVARPELTPGLVTVSPLEPGLRTTVPGLVGTLVVTPLI